MSGTAGARPTPVSRTSWPLPILGAVVIAVLFSLPSGLTSAPVGHPGTPLTSISPSAQLHQAAAQAILPGFPPAHATPGAQPMAGPHPVWSNLASKVGTAPSPRYLGAMVYDPVDNYVVLFGGAGSSGPIGDTWTYSNGVWTQLSPSSSPSARYLAYATWDSADGYLLLFGGYDSSTATAFNDTWTFLHGSWVQLSPATAPAPRCRGAIAFDPSDKYVVLYGGSGSLTGTTFFSDTWNFSKGVWTNLTTSVTGKPGPLFRVSASEDIADGSVVMFGGCTSSTCNPTSSLTWTYQNLTWTKQAPSSVPGGRAYTALTYDPQASAVLMFAGDNEATNTAYDDTWLYANGSWTQLTSQLTTAPSTRAFEMMAFDAGDGYVVLWGGQNPSTVTYFNDTWAFGPSVIGPFTASPPAIDLGQSVTFNATPFAFSGYANTTYPSLPPGCVSANVTVLTCTPTATGLFNVSVMQNDTRGPPSTRNLTLSVLPDPVLASYASSLATVTAGTKLWLNATVANGTPPYAYAWTGLPPGCASASSASIACVPGATANGSYRVQVNAADAAGFHVFGNVSVLVNPKPSVLSFTTSRPTIDLGQSVLFSVNTSGGTPPLNYSYANLPTGCTGADLATVSCTPTQIGTFIANVTVTDSFGWSASASATVQVNADPSISAFVASPAAFDLGHATTFYLNASGGTGTLTYSYTGLPSGCVLGAAAGGSCTPTQNGTHVVTGTAIDSLGFHVSSTVTITIADDPQVTAITAVPPTVDVGQTFVLTVTYTGGTAPFSFSYNGLPLGCSGLSTATVTCTPKSAASLTITAVVTDAWKQSSQLAQSVVVTAAPSIGSFTVSSASVTIGAAVLLSVGVAGGSGVYTYAYTGLPTGCASQNASSLSCTSTQTGSFNVTVNVTDSAGLSAHSFVVFAVTAAPSGGGSGSFSLTSGTGLLVVLVIVIVVVVAAVAMLMMRRRRPPKAAPAAEWQEASPEGEAPP